MGQNGEIGGEAFTTDMHAARANGRRQRILLIHQNFPGQFRHLAVHLHQREDVEVIGLGRDTAPGLKIPSAPGEAGKTAPREFPWFKYKLHRQVKKEAHPYLRQMEAAVLHGQAVARALAELKRKGFTPDIILAHPGWGETLYAKQIFPDVKLIHFCEWYYSTEGADFNFDPEFPSTLDDNLRITTWNALHLLNLENCDAAVAPTQWQKSRFPAAYQHKIEVIHEGIDTANLSPDPEATLPLPLRHFRETTSGENSEELNEKEAEATLILKAGDPIITYVARNLEPYRGFHTFMRALPKVLKVHPTAHVLIVGGDSRSYGSMPKDAKHWREKMLWEVKGDLGESEQHLHFLGKVSYETYKKVLQISAAHVYLTYPFVLSWSLLEAMATGCQIIASDTAPVREVIRHGQNGVLTDFFNAKHLATQMIEALNNQAAARILRQVARTDAKAYALQRGLSAYLELLGLSVEAVASNA
ncbi:MAG TPA: glycosyltransferase family 4 protein [Rhodocyclaceae bacterium]|nr:glycosyltransferase family 4 protein [Rhodocyclaceae bacterium]